MRDGSERKGGEGCFVFLGGSVECESEKGGEKKEKREEGIEKGRLKKKEPTDRQTHKFASQTEKKGKVRRCGR